MAPGLCRQLGLDGRNCGRAHCTTLPASRINKSHAATESASGARAIRSKPVVTQLKSQPSNPRFFLAGGGGGS